MMMANAMGGGDFYSWFAFLTWLVWLAVGVLLCVFLWKKITKE